MTSRSVIFGFRQAILPGVRSTEYGVQTCFVISTDTSCGMRTLAECGRLLSQAHTADDRNTHSTLCLFVGPQSALYKIFHLNIYLPSTLFPLQFLRQLLRMLLDLFKLPWPADHVQKRPQIMAVVIWVLNTSLASPYHMLGKKRNA